MPPFKRGFKPTKFQGRSRVAYQDASVSRARARFTSGRGAGSAQTAALVAAMRKNSGEKKVMTRGISESVVEALLNNNNSSYTINSPTVGTGSFNRIGKKIYLKSLRVKAMINYSFSPDGVGTLLPNLFRMVVVWDKAPNGATRPSWNQIFGYTQQDGTEATATLAGIAQDASGRFQILRDKVIALSPQIHPDAGTVTTGTGHQMHHIDEYIKLGNRETTFSAETGGQYTSISTGGLLVYYRAEYNGANSFVVVQEGQARLVWTD